MIEVVIMKYFEFLGGKELKKKKLSKWLFCFCFLLSIMWL